MHWICWIANLNPFVAIYKLVIVKIKYVIITNAFWVSWAEQSESPTSFQTTFISFWFLGCEVVFLGLKEGCSYACNQTLQERPSCFEGCRRGSEEFKTTLIKLLGNVAPPQPLANKAKSYSVEMVFSKHHLKQLQSQHPQLDFGKSPFELIFDFLLLSLICLQIWHFGHREYQNSTQKEKNGLKLSLKTKHQPILRLIYGLCQD